MAGVLDTIGMGRSGHFNPGSSPSSSHDEPAWDIARLFPPQGKWTAEQYLQLTEQVSWPIEFTRGTIEFLPMPTIEHQLIVKHLVRRLDDFVEQRDLGTVLFSPLPTWLSEETYREPDVLYVTKARHAQSDKYYRGIDLAMEVVSDDDRSHQRDHVEKPALYAAAGVDEYWIVDPQEKSVQVLTLVDDRYQPHAKLIGTGTASSKLLEGFSLDVGEVFAAAKKG